MKRAWFIIIAAICALLLYPSANLSAKSQNHRATDGLHIIVPADDTIPIGNTEGEEEGDGDGVAGFQGNNKKPPSGLTSGQGLNRVGLVFKMWWNTFLKVR